MSHLETLQRQREQRRKIAERMYKQICLVRKTETKEDKFRRGLAGLNWVADYLLETDAFIEECVFDGRALKRPGREGAFDSINGGYKFGFEIPMETRLGHIVFPLYAMALVRCRKEIMQCPSCRIVYSRPIKIDMKELRKQRTPKPYYIGGE